MFPRLAGRAPYVSLRWSEENVLDRAFYKHLAPNGAKGNNVQLHFKVESETRNNKSVAVEGSVTSVSGKALPVLPEKNHPARVCRRLDIEAPRKLDVARQCALHRLGRLA